MDHDRGPGEVVARRVTVHGMVQGVGFRFNCLHEAQRLGVTGWVRNEPDGTVAGHFEGPAGAVDALVDWCRSGPSHAGVDSVQASDAVPQGHSRFGVD